jgi:hypothetical protein
MHERSFSQPSSRWRATVVGTAAAELPARVVNRPQSTSSHDSATYGCGLARRCPLCPSILPPGCLRPDPGVTGDPLPCSGSVSRRREKKVLAP